MRRWNYNGFPPWRMYHQWSPPEQSSSEQKVWVYFFLSSHLLSDLIVVHIDVVGNLFNSYLLKGRIAQCVKAIWYTHLCRVLIILHIAQYLYSAGSSGGSPFGHSHQTHPGHEESHDGGTAG